MGIKSFVLIAAIAFDIATSQAHSAVVDGVNDFTPDQTYLTNAVGSTGYLAADNSTLSFGIDHSDVASGGSNQFFVAYIGTGSAGSNSGLSFGTQQPNLSFIASHVFAYRLDSGDTSLYQWDGATFDITHNNSVFTPTAEVGTFFETAIDFSVLGISVPSTVNFAAYILNELPGFEASYSAFPADTFSAVAYDPDLSTHISINALPIPAAVWLFGSGLIGLIGVARRKKV